MRKIIPVVKVLIYFFITLTVIFIFLELTLRFYEYINPYFVIMPDDTYLRYRGKPNYLEFGSFRINSRGYKDVEFNEQKNKGVFRILALGDSMTYGLVPYKYTYITLLEENLKRRGENVEILNCGIPGTKPVDYLSLFINEGIALNPDLVLVNIYVGDDFNRGGTRSRASSYFRAIAFINEYWSRYKKPEGRIFSTTPYKDNLQFQSEETYIDFLKRVECHAFRKDNDRFTRDFNSAVGYIKKIKDLCDLHGYKFAVIICPNQIQVNPYIRNRLLEELHIGPEVFDIRIPNRMMAEEFKKSGIIFIDLTEDCVAEYKRTGIGLYNPNDSHWNIAGNRFAYERISGWLTRVMDKL